MTNLAIVGATGTGKTSLALELWRRVPGLELVSIDSMAVYRGLDIGTETPTAPHPAWHLVNIADPGDDFSVANFQAAARVALAGIAARGHVAVLVGGTGLYHRAVVDGLELPGRFPAVVGALDVEADTPDGLARLYERLVALDPLAASRIEPGNRRRIVRALEVTVGSGRGFSSFGPGLEHYPSGGPCLVGLALDRAELDRRLAVRLDSELAAGWIAEVAVLAGRAGGLSRTARQAIGYRELLRHIDDDVPLDVAKGEILQRLKAFARRQEAWFRRDPRVAWFDATSPDLVEQVLQHWAPPAGRGAEIAASRRDAAGALSWETYES